MSLWLFSLVVNAQISNTLVQTWMGGDSTSNSYGVYGSLGVASASNKPGAREGCGITWTDASGNLWMFGGYGYGVSTQGYLSDLWKYDPIAKMWTWVNGNNTTDNTGSYGTKGVASVTNQPPGRHIATAWSDNAGNLWMFGGSSPLGTLNDLWKYNIAANLWTWLSGDNTANNYGVYGTRGTASATNKPGARGRTSRPDGKADALGNLWLFGGNGNAVATSGDLNDLWKYNIATNQWTWMGGDNVPTISGIYGTMGVASAFNKPGYRVGGVCWVDSANKFWLSGGSGSPNGWSPKYSDLWKFDPVTSQWTWMKGDSTFNNYGVYGALGVSAATNNPGGRLMACNWIDNYGNFWVFGGYGYSAVATGNATGTQGLNDLWKYDPRTNNWTWMKGDNVPDIPCIYGTMGVSAATNKLGERSGGDQWKDGNGNLWQFGGLQWDLPTTWKNDLWKIVIPQPVAKGNLSSCQVLPTVTIDATNDTSWVPVFDNTGNIAAEIKANGNVLGIVNTSIFTKNGNCREDIGHRLYLNRNITITPQFQPASGNVSVRLYILKSELDTLKTARNSLNQPSGVASISQVDVFKNNDLCLTIGTNTALALATTSGSYSSDYYLQESIPSFSSFYFANNTLESILPVKLWAFTGKHQTGANVLEWMSACTIGFSFEVERSINGNSFIPIGNVSVSPGCNGSFQFIDFNPVKAGNYYRIKIMESGSSPTYSNVILLQSSMFLGSFNITLTPNPVQGNGFELSTQVNKPIKGDLHITDLQGREVMKIPVLLDTGTSHVHINLTVVPGIYFLYAQSMLERSNVLRFVKE